MTSPPAAISSPTRFENACRSSSSLRTIGRLVRTPSAISPSSRPPAMVGTAISVAREEPFLEGAIGRIRDVREGPDGLVYLLTDESPGGLYRLEPA